MRPEVLFPLFKPLTALPKVGPNTAKTLAKLCGGEHVVDLLWHLPQGLIDRSYAPNLNQLEPGRVATLTLRIDDHIPPPRRGLPYRVTAGDDTGAISLVFFHAHADYLKKQLPVGETRIISGRVETYGRELQMAHPDHIAKPEEADQLPKVEPVYPLTAGISGKVLGRVAQAALRLAPTLTEWDVDDWLKKQGWPSWQQALTQAHAPACEADLSPEHPARARLAYDELLANQLALALVRGSLKKAAGRPTQGDGRLQDKVHAALPFTLTGAQQTAVQEIQGDMASNDRMLRLLQGDVGSGKTVVALLAMLAAVEAGGQAVIMAPTEILARQHLETIRPLAEAAGVSVALLTGREKGKNREGILAGFADGTTNIAVGTHALFQDGVAFQGLKLAVIDEQHRFGVHQRLTLAAKGTAVDVLVMTATPIPRTLMLTAYGDMDVSRLREKPAGRQPVDTRVLPDERIEEVVNAVGRALKAGTKVYWVCPLVEESESLDLAAAEDRYDHLKALFPGKVGLVHGRMKGKDKDAMMAAFADGEVDLLVATTVIEVGVDVPKATVMVIEHAERFGLAQLHQLRGRIGRGADKSTCLLLYKTPLTETAKARLKVLRETEDGFVIAEEDLKLRGAGELLGTRQSGLPEFRLADLTVHAGLLAAARDDAALILNKDPNLTSERGAALRTLLYLFERDQAVRLLRSG